MLEYVCIVNNGNLETFTRLELSRLKDNTTFQFEKGKMLDTAWQKNHLIYIGFFIFLASQVIVFTGHFCFYVKGYGFATVNGISMLPTMKNGQTVVISYDIPVGNLTNVIVVFGDENICHRCIKDEGQWLTFKGDNNSFSEHATRDELKAIFVKVSQNPFLDLITLGFQ